MIEYDSSSSATSSPSDKAAVGIKICGMKYLDNIKEIGSLLPDYMGFIFWEKSARYFDGVIPPVAESIKKTGVFVNASVLEISDKVNKYDLQAVQLHGQESVEFCSELKSKLSKNIEIIKVFSIIDTFDFDELKPFEGVCDFFLFDTKGKLPGGNGTTFDWKVLADYPSQKPFFLSGGIGLEELNDVKQILKLKLPIYAIDLNSKFEIEAGLKDKNILSEFQQKLKL